jgi:hypothetical protein
MFDEPDDDKKSEHASSPAQRAKERAQEVMMYAELYAIFEGTRKFEAEIRAGLDPEVARNVQKTIGLAAKKKVQGTPVLAPEAMPAARELLDAPEQAGLSTNDYHIYRRPGEVMMLRWLAGEEVESFYERMQAHLDAGIGGIREDEHSSLDWKADEPTKAYLAELDKLEPKAIDWYGRDAIRKHDLIFLSTWAADEMNIAFLADQIMGTTPEEIVGNAFAPPSEPSESDLAWFFKLFCLRGMKAGVEQMCFFTYLQKVDEEF